MLAADAFQEHAPAVDRDFELVRVLEPANHVEVVAEQPEVELVFAVERKHVRHGYAPDGAERQPLELRRLRLVAFDRVRLRADHDVRVADGHCADTVGSGEIALEQCRGEHEQVADIVEAERRIVGRQQGVHVHLEIEQIANRVRILGAIQAPERRCAGVRLGGGIERGGEPGRERIVGRRFRAQRILRRHRARPQFPNDSLPELWILVYRRRVEARYREVAGELGHVVALGAVTLEGCRSILGRADDGDVVAVAAGSGGQGPRQGSQTHKRVHLRGRATHRFTLANASEQCPGNGSTCRAAGKYQ